MRAGLGYVGETGMFPGPRTPEPPERGMASGLLYRALYDRQTGDRVVEVDMSAHEAMVERAEEIFAEWIEQGLIKVTDLGRYAFGLHRIQGIG